MLNRDFKLSIPCPQCKKEIQETIARLETNPVLVCSACGNKIPVEADKLRRAFEEAERLPAEFRRKFPGLK